MRLKQINEYREVLISREAYMTCICLVTSVVLATEGSVWPEFILMALAV